MLCLSKAWTFSFCFIRALRGFSLLVFSFVFMWHITDDENYQTDIKQHEQFVIHIETFHQLIRLAPLIFEISISRPNFLCASISVEDRAA